MDHSGLTNLSDLVLRLLENDRMNSILSTANDLHLTGTERDENVYIAGVSYGAEKAQDLSLGWTQANISAARKALKIIDDKLNEMPDPAVAVVLAEARTPLADHLNSLASIAADSMVRSMEDQVGIPREVLRGNKHLSDFSDEELILMGLRLFNCKPTAMFGWHLANRKKKVLDCLCTACADRYFEIQREDGSKVLTDIVKTYRSLDAALLAYLEDFVSGARKTLKDSYSPIAQLAHISEETVADGYAAALARIIGSGAAGGPTEDE